MEESILDTSNQTFLMVKEINELLDVFDFDYTLKTDAFTNDELEELFLYRYGERQTNQSTAVSWARVLKASWLKNLFKYNEIFNAYFDITKFDTVSMEEDIATTALGDSEFIEPSIEGTGTESPASKNNNSAESTVARTSSGRNGLSFIEDIKKLNEIGNPVDEFLSSVAQDVLLHYVD